jgi:hypothetical protein
MRKQLVWLIVAAAVAAMPVAAQNGAWFGTPLPPGASDPRKPIMKHDDAFPPLPVSFAKRPGRHDDLLDGAALKADQKRIVGFSLESLSAGDKVWGRRAATPAFMQTRVDGQRIQDGRAEDASSVRRSRPDGVFNVKPETLTDPASAHAM